MLALYTDFVVFSTAFNSRRSPQRQNDCLHLLSCVFTILGRLCIPPTPSAATPRGPDLGRTWFRKFLQAGVHRAPSAESRVSIEGAPNFMNANSHKNRSASARSCTDDKLILPPQPRRKQSGRATAPRTCGIVCTWPCVIHSCFGCCVSFVWSCHLRSCSTRCTGIYGPGFSSRHKVNALPII